MVKPLQLKILFVMIVFLIASCAPAAPTPVSHSTFTDSDEEMAAAVRKAQDSLYMMRQALLAPKPSYSFLSVKVRFRSSRGTEDMWTVPVDFFEEKYVVRMVEGVTLEKGAHPDHIVEVTPQDVLDWMILEKDGTVIGGYTLRLEYERMTPEQKKRFDEVTGYKFKKQ